MIISDLNHVEVVSEEAETSIVGGYYFPYYGGTSNYASAGAGALAFGRFSSASTLTSTFTASGVASSSSGSRSSSVNHGWFW
jgi:hypothetical protein